MTRLAKPPARITRSVIRKLGDKIAAHKTDARRLCIINYHRILNAENPFLDTEPNIVTFEWQMKLLAECFNVLPLSQAVDELMANELPPRAVCITFDDGYRSVRDCALPILNKLNLPATVFISTGYIENKNMWNDIIMSVVQNLSDKTLDLRSIGLGTYALSNIEQRRYAIESLTQSLKYQSLEVRHDLLQKLEELTGKRLADPLMLTKEMVKELSERHIEIGAHTVSHPILARIDDNAARYEIETSKRQLEEIIQKPVLHFAYPNGKIDTDFDERHMQIAREAGFTAAFTTAVGAASKDQHRYLLPRSRPWDSTPLFFGLRLLRWLSGRQ